MDKGAAQPQTKQNERSEFCAGPSRPASPDTARPPQAAGPKKAVVWTFVFIKIS
ncbi:hypothetical protein SGRA_0049 [Saprospira grandis str. Lewin]|uniref:Uncharacterized protein n=1 Tax=Saprospira grandis (strain Lewin) TaxID=984262 RepID=H6L4B5_SAPGL|nr:hypothetical protein SGRA_0049 [Saprospira grandis str. Lewin]